MLFDDRAEAGRKLVQALARSSHPEHLRVYALPGGGLVVATEVARALDAPLDVVLARRLPVPGQEHLSFGAVAHGGVRAIDRRAVERLHITEQTIAVVAAQEEKALDRAGRWWPGHETAPDLQGATAIFVDDGLASPSMIRAALVWLRLRRTAGVIAAVPVCTPDVHSDLAAELDDVVHIAAPRPLRNVADWYGEPEIPPDEELRRMLERAASGRSTRSA